MPRLSSLAGIRMMIKHPTIKGNFKAYYEAVYRKHLEDNGFSFEDHGKHMLTILPDGMKIISRNKITYSFVLDEIFLSQEYNFGGIEGKTVIDIGASIGDTALYFIGKGAGKVYAFEPIKEHYDLAVENVKLNGLQNKVIVYQEPATSKRLAQLVEDEKISNALLKVDCEGCEYEVIKNADLSPFEQIILEFHGDHKELEEWLTEKGFSVSRHRDQINARR